MTVFFINYIQYILLIQTNKMFIEIDTENDSDANINSDAEPYYTLNLEKILNLIMFY